MRMKVQYGSGDAFCFWTKEMSVDLAEQLHGLVVERTMRGVDRHGAPFAPYAETTAEVDPGASGTPSLMRTGDMLARLRPAATRTKAKLVLQWRNLAKYPFYLDSGTGANKSRMPARSWFGITTQGVDAYLMPLYLRLLDVQMRRWDGGKGVVGG